MKIRHKDIAIEAGVSIMTVNRYINQSGAVSEDARRRIEAAMQKLGYDPNLSPRLARRPKTYRMGLLTSYSKDIFNSRYHTHIASGIMSALHESDYNLQIIFIKDKSYSRLEEILKEYSVDGLFILTWRIHPNLIHLIEHCPKHLPVMLFNDYDPKVQANFVYSDVSQGIQMAVDYLVQKGRRNIGFLKGPSFIQFGEGKTALRVASIDALDKWEGFQKAMEQKKVPIRKDWVRECGAYTMIEGYKMGKEILEQKELPDSIVCSNDEIAIGVLNAMKEKKIRCPEQVSVIGFDGIEKGELSTPPLTTVEQLLSSMGYQAGKSLVDIAEGKLIDPIHTKFVPKLVIRESA